MNKTNLFKALLLALAGATIFTACDKENEPVIDPPHNGGHDTTTVIQPEPHYNVELIFNAQDISHIHVDTIKKHDTNTRVDTIFIMPEDEYCLTGLTTNGVVACRNLLQQCVDASPKVRGKGDLVFGSKIYVNPADSLWFVQQGWTVNERRRNQR